MGGTVMNKNCFETQKCKKRRKEERGDDSFAGNEPGMFVASVV